MAEGTRSGLFIVLLSLLISVRSARTPPGDHIYAIGDDVPLFANKVGPLNNPSETYQYYDLPFCRPVQVIEKEESLREVLNGDRLTNTLYKLKFREEKIVEDLCKKTLTREEVAKFRNAIKNEFYFQMTYDDLTLWGFIGKVEKETFTPHEAWPRYSLFKHVRFDVLYNKNQIIEVRAFCNPNYAVDITEDIETNVEFAYSVFWNATSTKFENRMDKYSRHSSLPDHLQIQLFSVINAIVIVIFLAGLLSTLFMRTLKNDLSKNCTENEEVDKEEVGWKRLRGDVFRCPPYSSLLFAILGIGTQLLAMFFLVFGLIFLGVLYPYNRGTLSTTILAIYALTSIVAGYTAASFHIQLAGSGSVIRSVILSGILYPGPLYLTFSILNTVATSYGATAAVPFGFVVVIQLISIFVIIPLLIAGGVIGHAFRSNFQASFSTRRLPLEIPRLAWYRRTPPQMFIGGLLPFSIILIELHYVCRSMWGYKIYAVCGVIFIVFVILIILTAILSIGLTYLQLSGEDHKWWWRSVLCGGSTSIFMFAYCIYFYSKSNMSGFMQLSFFIGYNACICYAFFLMLGTIGFCSSLIFVRHIYRTAKLE